MVIRYEGDDMSLYSVTPAKPIEKIRITFTHESPAYIKELIDKVNTDERTSFRTKDDQFLITEIKEIDSKTVRINGIKDDYDNHDGIILTILED